MDQFKGEMEEAEEEEEDEWIIHGSNIRRDRNLKPGVIKCAPSPPAPSVTTYDQIITRFQLLNMPIYTLLKDDDVN